MIQSARHDVVVARGFGDDAPVGRLGARALDDVVGESDATRGQDPGVRPTKHPLATAAAYPAAAGTPRHAHA
ncbi:hypothetical protein CLV56_0294 [Mumia flava]|uniref:Uncharacterized protein n=1 Tax=Mumia flava TaxID=1348852 RepID=A0A0B2B2R2_9ACTN|nr:hypothetical protein [Mumia flava]PJJ56090.1 hypothetical protein CLV56_0294 [Mumia flava]